MSVQDELTRSAVNLKAAVDLPPKEMRRVLADEAERVDRIRKQLDIFGRTLGAMMPQNVEGIK